MFDGLYSNIGGKIKSWAKGIFVVEAIAAIIGGIIAMCTSVSDVYPGGYEVDSTQLIIGLLVLVLGPFVALVSTWVLYGFGELIEKTCAIERNTRGGEKKSETQSQIDDERIRKLESLRSQGLITEEEYQQAISKRQ